MAQQTITIWAKAPSRAKYPLVTIEPFAADEYGEPRYWVTLGLQRTGRTNQSRYWYQSQVDNLINSHRASGNRIEGEQ